MLSSSTCVATVATADITAARSFYTETLGLPAGKGDDNALSFHLPDGSSLMVYHRPDHQAPENTVVTFVVADARAEVADLRGKGVVFEEYDLPGMRTVDGILGDESGSTMAWFKDPAGNILGIMSLPAA